MLDCLEYLNLYTLAIFVCAVLAIVFVRQLLSPFLQLKDHIPIPFEFFMIAIAAFLAYLLDVNIVYDVETTQFIGESFRLSSPRLQLFRPLLLDAFALALLIYGIHWHLCSEIAKEQKYKIDSRQVNCKIVTFTISQMFRKRLH
jgi:MFS superfamily sulfate permease-like transporter